MTHEEVNNLLAAYLDNEVTPEERKEIEAHLSQCSQCRRDLQSIKIAQDTLRLAFKEEAVGADPSPTAWTQLLPELEGQRPSFLIFFRRRKWRIVGTIVVLAIIVTLAILWATGVLPGPA
jgi:anti-sigma factor RsiW